MSPTTQNIVSPRPSYEPFLHHAIAAAKLAGQILRTHFHQTGGPVGEGGHAEADSLAEAAIREHLTLATPDSGIVGEELGHLDRECRTAEAFVWVVDPNDGTRSFPKGHRGTAVSIALLHQGQPVAGVVLAFAGLFGEPDLIAGAVGVGLFRNSEKIVRKPWAEQLATDSIVLVSQDADKNAAANAAICKPARFMAMPSIAYRLALAAVGDAEVAVSLNGPIGWDYAGGHALLRCVGGELYNSSGEPVVYSLTGLSAVGGICAGGSPSTAPGVTSADWSGVFQRRAGAAVEFGAVSSTKLPSRPDDVLLNRAQGVMLGLLTGDALGAQVEFKSAQQIKSMHPHGVREIADGGTWNTLAGQPTDDGEMALMLARSILASNTYDPTTAARAYCHWGASGPYDMGGTTRASLRVLGQALQKSQSVTLAMASHEDPETQANGALMRVAPIAITGVGCGVTIDQRLEWARIDAGLTHPSPVCRSANMLFVWIIDSLLAGREWKELIRTGDWGWKRDAGAFDESVIETSRRGLSERPESYEAKQGWVLIALQNAIFQAANAESFESGLVDTVSQGGDTDTNGAIAGAVLGARFGALGIPKRWREITLTCRALEAVGAVEVRPQEFWPVDCLLVAERLLMIDSR